ncbi:MAG: DUF3093 domain-containing protein [Micromonosporaceae bacterium]
MPQHPTTARYAERLALPWWLWLSALAVTALLAAEIHLGAPGVRSWTPYVVLLPASAAGLWWLGRIRVAVEDGTFVVDDARLPVGVIAGAEPLDPEQKRELLGPRSHPLAFVVQRPWIRGAVKVTLDDPDDPTPYWVVSCRRPESVITAITEAQQTGADSR